jgi:hypothetical protein
MSDLVEVTGEVSFADAPGGPGFVVSFLPESGGRPSQAITDEDGRFRMLYTTRRTGVVRGRHRVIVGWPYVDGSGPSNPLSKRLPAAVSDPSHTPFVFEIDSPRQLSLDVLAPTGGP